MMEENEEFLKADDKNFFYCMQCGTKLEDGNNFCTNCGFQINPSFGNYIENQRKYHYPNYNNKLKPKIDWKPPLIGGLTAIGVSFLLGFIAPYFMMDMDIWTMLGVFVILNFASLFVGGFLAGAIAKNNGGTYGAYAGLVCSLISIPINVAAGIPMGIFSIFWAIIWAMLFAGLGGLVGYYITKSSKLQNPTYYQTNYV